MKTKKKIKEPKVKVKPEQEKKVIRYHDIKISLDTHHLENVLEVHKRMLDVQSEAIKQTKIQAQSIVKIDHTQNVSVLDSVFISEQEPPSNAIKFSNQEDEDC